MLHCKWTILRWLVVLRGCYLGPFETYVTWTSTIRRAQRMFPRSTLVHDFAGANTLAVGRVTHPPACIRTHSSTQRGAQGWRRLPVRMRISDRSSSCQAAESVAHQFLRHSKSDASRHDILPHHKILSLTQAQCKAHVRPLSHFRSILHRTLPAPLRLRDRLAWISTLMPTHTLPSRRAILSFICRLMEEALEP